MKIYLLLGCLITQIAFAQTSPIDSLKHELTTLEKQPVSRARDSVAFYYVDGLARAYLATQLDSSVAYSSRLIDLCKRQDFQYGLLNAYIFLGYVRRVQGKNFESVRMLYKALMIAEKRQKNSEIAYVFYSMAHSYHNLKNYPKALDFCRKSLAILKKHPDASTEMETLNVYGAIFKDQHNYPQALTQFKRFYILAKANNQIWYEAQSLNDIGWTYQSLHQLDSAAVYYRNSLQLGKKAGSLDLEGAILLNLIGLQMEQQHWPDALKNCLNLRTRLIAVNSTSHLLEIDEKLHLIYQKLGRSDESLTAYERYITLKDSLSRETNEGRIELLQAQYTNVQNENRMKTQQVQLLLAQNNSQQLAQTRNSLLAGLFVILLVVGLLFWNNRRLESKNRLISQQTELIETARTQLASLNQSLEVRVQERTFELREANVELIQKNEEIKMALFKGQTIERKRVASELHDNLSSLLSALNMSIQGINPAGLSQKEQTVYQNIRHMMTNAYAEVRNISHNILPAELEKEGLVTVLTKLIARLNDNSPIHFSLQTELPANRLPVEIEFNLYSIVLELLNNVIRHAQATEATVRLAQTSADITLSVIDNGQGFDATAGDGVGLQNIQSRLDALSGSFRVISRQTQGTTISVSIPSDLNIEVVLKA